MSIQKPIIDQLIDTFKDFDEIKQLTRDRQSPTATLLEEKNSKQLSINGVSRQTLTEAVEKDIMDELGYIPSLGHIAGGFIAASIIRRCLGYSIQASDIDWFVNKPMQDKPTGPIPFKGIAYTYKMRGVYYVISTERSGKLNIINISERVSSHQLLNDFDINVCMVGYDCERKELHLTNQFVLGLTTQSIRCHRVSSPICTALRLLKKSRQMKEFTLNRHREFSLLAQPTIHTMPRAYLDRAGQIKFPIQSLESYPLGDLIELNLYLPTEIKDGNVLVGAPTGVFRISSFKYAHTWAGLKQALDSAVFVTSDILDL